LTLWAAVLAVAAGIVAFFVWANRQTAKAHARFTTKDVEIALSELLDPRRRLTTLGIYFSRGRSMSHTSNPFVRSA
jgi:hypothetical protein